MLKCSDNPVRNIKFVLLFSMLPGIFSHHTCSINICLRWTFKQGTLTINCKVDDLYLPVYIRNNFGNEIANCGTPFPSTLCKTLYKNTTIEQNVKTNVTTAKVKVGSGHSINGKWACQHGIGRPNYEYVVEISIPTLKGPKHPERKEELSCFQNISVYTVKGIVISVLMITICLGIMCAKCCKAGQRFKRKISSILKKIDNVFETKRCGGPSVKKIKVGFYLCLVILVITAGGLISVFVNDSCQGSVCFLVFTIILCVLLVILFLRTEANKNAGVNSEEVDEQRENLVYTESGKGEKIEVIDETSGKQLNDERYGGPAMVNAVGSNDIDDKESKIAADDKVEDSVVDVDTNTEGDNRGIVVVDMGPNGAAEVGKVEIHAEVNEEVDEREKSVNNEEEHSVCEKEVREKGQCD